MKFVPFVLRVLLSLVTWLVVLPLCTAYLYQGWMHSPTSIPGRLDRGLVVVDGVAGAVVAAVVVLSFLSLMSLADFMRFQWRQNPEEGGAEGRNNPNANDDANANVNVDANEGAAVGEAGGQAENNDAAAREGNDDANDDEEQRAVAAMPEPFELEGRGGVPVPVATAAPDEPPRPGPRRHRDHHHRGQRERQRDLSPINQGVDDGFLENDDVHNEHHRDAEEARRRMDSTRDRIEERRRRSMMAIERRRPPSDTDSDVGDDGNDDDGLPPLDASMSSWLGHQQPSAPEPSAGVSADTPQLHRNAMDVMDGGEPFFSYDSPRRERMEDDDDDIRRRRRLLAEVALQRQGGSQSPIREEEEMPGALINDPVGLAIGRAGDDVPSDDSSAQYESDDSSLQPPSTQHQPPSPPSEPAGLDPDEAALDDMMRVQEEAMLGLDSDAEEDDELDPAVPGARRPAHEGPPANEEARPQVGGGMFEPQFEPLDPAFDQDEAMVSSIYSGFVSF